MNTFKLNASMLASPDYLVPSAWSGHLPFAGWVVEALRPRVLVELGTHRGLSFMAFCQAMASNAVDGRCYAVDTWEGDPHAGSYGAEVYDTVAEYRARKFPGFTELMRMTFDEAAAYFHDASIDLLHIDGLHTYEAVRHDFETWLPKMSSRGVVLFHDTSVREREFGVWRYWAEICERYPSFEFTHSHGLGVLAVGNELPDALRALFTLDEDERQLVRRLMERLGQREEADREMARLHAALEHERGLQRALAAMVGVEPVMGADQWTTLRHDIAHVKQVLLAAQADATHHVRSDLALLRERADAASGR